MVSRIHLLNNLILASQNLLNPPFEGWLVTNTMIILISIYLHMVLLLTGSKGQPICGDISPLNLEVPSRTKFSILFSSSCYPKLTLSFTINKLVYYELVVMENVSLVELDPEKKTNNFIRFLLCRTLINRMIKCYRKGGGPYKCI